MESNKKAPDIDIGYLPGSGEIAPDVMSAIRDSLECALQNVQGLPVIRVTVARTHASEKEGTKDGFEAVAPGIDYYRARGALQIALSEQGSRTSMKFIAYKAKG